MDCLKHCILTNPARLNSYCFFIAATLPTSTGNVFHHLTLMASLTLLIEFDSKVRNSSKSMKLSALSERSYIT